MTDTSVGVDLGTCNSTIIGLPVNGVPEFVKTPQGDIYIPSAIYYPHKSGEAPLVGRPALAKLPDKNVIFQPKRCTGISPWTLKKRGLEGSFNAEIAETPCESRLKREKEKAEKADSIKFLIEVDGQIVKKEVVDVLADMVNYFKHLVTTKYGDKVNYVFSSPQYYGPTQSEAYRKAIVKGLGSEQLLVDIISEPLAAQFAYQAQKMRDPAMKRLLVLDLGAGTFDISFLRVLEDGAYQGTCTGGDDHLGGSDMDRLFLSALENEIKQDSSFQKEKFEKRKTEFLKQMQEMKHNLSLTDSVTVEIYGCTTDGFSFTVNTAKKQDICADFYIKLQKVILDTFERKVKNTKKSPETLMKEVQVIYVVGGPTRDESVCDAFQKLFPGAIFIGKPGTEGALDPVEVVGHGNVFWCAAQKRAITKIGLPPKPKHVPCLSKTIGVEGVSRDLQGNIVSHFCPVLEANKRLPCDGESKGFTTSEEDQEAVVIKVFMGEGEFTNSDGVEFIGEYTIPIRFPNKLDEIFIDVEMEVTESNVLIVRAGDREFDLVERQFDIHN